MNLLGNRLELSNIVNRGLFMNKAHLSLLQSSFLFVVVVRRAGLPNKKDTLLKQTNHISSSTEVIPEIDMPVVVIWLSKRNLTVNVGACDIIVRNFSWGFNFHFVSPVRVPRSPLRRLCSPHWAFFSIQTKYRCSAHRLLISKEQNIL